MGQRFSPTTVWYHCQASGLMGSPTVPRTFRDSRPVLETQRQGHGSKPTKPLGMFELSVGVRGPHFCTGSLPYFISILMAVGAV